MDFFTQSGDYSCSRHTFEIGSKTLLDSTLATAAQYPVQGNVCGYVTELQIHMALQARHLLPGFEHNGDQRLSPVHQAQADMERAASRQWF